MKFFYKTNYLKGFDKLSRAEQELVLKMDILIKKYLEINTVSFGLRVKHLGKNIFEGRVNDRVRIIWVREKDEVTFALLGNHEEVRRFIKRF